MLESLQPAAYFQLHSLIVTLIWGLLFFGIGIGIGALCWASYKKKAVRAEGDAEALRKRYAEIKMRLNGLQATSSKSALSLVNHD